MSTKLLTRIGDVLAIQYSHKSCLVWGNGDTLLGLWVWSAALGRHFWWGDVTAEAIRSAVVVSLCL